MLNPSILVGTGTPAAFSGNVSPIANAARQTVTTASKAESTSRSLAAVIELQSSLDADMTLNRAAELAAQKIGGHLAAQRVMILWRHRLHQPMVTIADTDQGGRDRGFELARLLTAAGEEVALRDAITRWPAHEAVERHGLMAISQLATELSTKSVSAIRLSDNRGQVRGAVVVLDPSDEASSGFLTVISSPLTGKLDGIERLQPTRLESMVRRFVETARGRRRNVILAVLAAIVSLMLVPVRYHVTADVELQPVKRRFVAVPFDGPLKSAHVRPGDVVQQGDLLAKIDPREIEYELAGIRAQWHRAEQEKKGLMAEHDFAASKIAGLESDRLRLQSDLLQYRHQNLEIRSPISGVVVSGDLEQSEGMPMSRGETLLEIAPLGRMVVEIAVPEIDVAEVREGMDVDFYVDAFPNRTMFGSIARIHPRAELREHDNVFVAEVEVDDVDQVLRPGMRGKATIVGDRHMLGWNLFHKAYFAILHAIGW